MLIAFSSQVPGEGGSVMFVVCVCASYCAQPKGLWWYLASSLQLSMLRH